MNTSDLRHLLAERATSHSGSTTDARLTGALARVRSIRRRRRLAAVAAALAATAVAIAVINVPSLVTAPEPKEQRNEDGFRLYEHGRELLASGMLRAGEQTVSVTATPSAFPLFVAHRCGEDRVYGEDEEIEEINVEISVGGQMFTGIGGECGGGGWHGNDADMWAERGVLAGEPATFTMTADKPATAETEVAMGIYQAVPWEEYPFPPRPDELPDLPPPLDQVDAVLESDPDDPNAARELMVGGPFSLDLDAQSPGIIHLRINGTEVDSIYSWDYGYRPLIPLNWPPVDEDAQRVEFPVLVEVRPEGFTGAWVIHVSER